jgi:hypothetical protein
MPTPFYSWFRSPTLLIAEAFVLAVLVGIGIAVAKGMSLQVAINGLLTDARV